MLPNKLEQLIYHIAIASTNVVLLQSDALSSLYHLSYTNTPRLSYGVSVFNVLVVGTPSRPYTREATMGPQGQQIRFSTGPDLSIPPRAQGSHTSTPVFLV